MFRQKKTRALTPFLSARSRSCGAAVIIIIILDYFCALFLRFPKTAGFISP